MGVGGGDKKSEKQGSQTRREGLDVETVLVASALATSVSASWPHGDVGRRDQRRDAPTSAQRRFRILLMDSVFVGGINLLYKVDDRSSPAI